MVTTSYEKHFLEIKHRLSDRKFNIQSSTYFLHICRKPVLRLNDCNILLMIDILNKLILSIVFLHRFLCFACNNYFMLSFANKHTNALHNHYNLQYLSTISL